MKWIAFVKNTSEGLNITANGIKFKPGDNVIINELEHGSNVYPWIHLRKKKVDVKIVPQRNGIIKIDDIASKINSRTKAISISSIQFQGYKVDLKKLSKDTGLTINKVQLIANTEIKEIYNNFQNDLV